jgi:transposase-like protein
MSREKARQYTTAEREQAVAMANQVGPTATAEAMNIPSGTVGYWQHMTRRSVAVPATPESVSVGAKTIEGEAAASRPSEQTAAKRAAKVYTPSQRSGVLEYAAANGVTAASKKFGISRFTITNWRRKVSLHAAGKSGDSPVVGSDENQTVVRNHRILAEWKAHPGLGPSQVRNQLRRQGLKISVHTVRCVLEENGYVTPRVRRETVTDLRYEAVRPNHMWHLDFLHRHVHKQKVYVSSSTTSRALSWAPRCATENGWPP